MQSVIFKSICVCIQVDGYSVDFDRFSSYIAVLIKHNPVGVA